MRQRRVVVHWVSVHDLVLHAAWATEENLMDALGPPISANTAAGCSTVLVLDNLDAAGNNNSDDQQHLNDHERRLVRNSIIQVLDQLVVQKQQRDVVVLGIGRESSQLAAELVKVGRLEKEVTMLPPSQSQREKILHSMLVQLMQKSTTTTSTDTDGDHCRCQEWSELLAIMTAGCVAVDLRRL
jgi:ATP-dependent 26S proteasome regulatory subunit